MATKKSAAVPAAGVDSEPDFPTGLPDASEAVEAIIEPALEMQETARHALEKGVEETRAAIEKGVAESRVALNKVKESAEEAASAFEASFAAAKDGVIEFNKKAFAAARANAEANLEFVQASFGVKTVSDLVTLQKDFARKQSEAVVVQFKDLAEVARKTVVGAVEPLKEQVTKTFKIAV